MRHPNPEPSTLAEATPATAPASQRYEPPRVEWEEEFAPVADSICETNPWDPSCQ